MTSCPFCAIVNAEMPAKVIRRWVDSICIEPLNPVVPGHMLIIPRIHVRDFTENPEVSAVAMGHAARQARVAGACNIITSVGKEATQSVFHLHIHIVPRKYRDGLHLPWTNQAK